LPCLYDAGNGDFFVVADDDRDQEMEDLRKLIASEPSTRPDLADPSGYIDDDFLLVSDAKGNMRLVRKFCAYKSDPRDPERWIEYTFEELLAIKAELDEITTPPDTEMGGRAALQVDRNGVEEAIKRSQEGERIFVATDEDGYYFAA